MPVRWRPESDLKDIPLEPKLLRSHNCDTILPQAQAHYNNGQQRRDWVVPQFEIDPQSRRQVSSRFFLGTRQPKAPSLT